jgi:hypothetical protein
MKFYRFIKPYLTYQIGFCIGVSNIGVLLSENVVEEISKEVFDEFLNSLKPKPEMMAEPCEGCGECEDCKSKTPEDVILESFPNKTKKK